MIQRFIGLEFEFPVVLPDGRSIHRPHIKAVWREFLRREKGWQPIIEHFRKTLTGVRRTRRDGRIDIINTDNGVGLLEFSPAPERDIQTAMREWKKQAVPLFRVIKDLGFVVLGLGMQPVTFNDRNRRTEKDWYLVLYRYLPGHYRFMSIAASQCAVDVAHDEAIRVVNTLNALSGVAIALCANSPIAAGKLQKTKETRQTLWDAAARAGGSHASFFGQIPTRPYKDFDDFLHYFWQLKSGIFAKYKKGGDYIPGFPPFERYITSGHAWKAKNVIGQPRVLTPSYEQVNIQSNYGWQAAKLHYTFTGGSLEELLEAYTSQKLNEYFANHARKVYIEFRPCATQPPGEEAVVAALALGIVENLSAAERLVSRYPWNAWVALRDIAVKDALSGKWRGKSVAAVAGEVLAVAREGLKQRGLGEEVYLTPLQGRVRKRRCPADGVIAWWKSGGVDNVLEQSRYKSLAF